MRVLLRTLCGCEKEWDVDPWGVPRVIKMPLLRPMPTLPIIKDVEKKRVRLFRLSGITTQDGKPIFIEEE